MRAVARLLRLPALSPVLVALAMPLAFGAPASADVFGPISLASESALQQAEYARDPVISGDSRFVAFDGSFGGATGVWRRDLGSGTVEQVAGGDAELPSISSDGRYVSFTTTARLTEGDHNEGPDVYVRDMASGSSSACTEGAQQCPFTLASAVDGGEEALSYGASSEASRYGSLAAGRTALSSDGRKVAFVTTATSDLLGPRPPQAPSTPAMQVAVRDLDTRSTHLVSVLAPAGSEPRPVSAQEAGKTIGAVYAPGQEPPRFEVSEAYGGARGPLGASISGDGATVAWLGVNVGKQAATLSEESLPAVYAEPLWRRIADGPEASTHRVSGGSDPLSPSCAASGETRLAGTPSLGDPCQGPFSTASENGNSGTWRGGVGNVVPQLSADGYTVAFLANAPLIAFGANFGRTENHSDAYVADMHAGLTRNQALRPLTELASGQSADLATNAPIVDLAISADGAQVAFTTKRTVFPLGVPAYVSAPAAVPGMVELFTADLADETLTRVTGGFEGGASEHPHEPQPTGVDPYLISGDGALSPSFASDGNMLAFSSTADNLVYGDGNTPPLGHESQLFDGSDAFVVSRVLFGSSVAQGYISPPPAPPALTPTWRLGASASSRRDGSVLLHVQVPGAGSLRVAARGSTIARAKAGSRPRRGRARESVVTQTVASRSIALRNLGLVSVQLKLAPRYAALARRRGGFSALVSLVFTASAHPALHERLEVTFARPQRKSSRTVRAKPRVGGETAGAR
ncbi:MAG TPA: hypothetical protein VFY45_05350 [Baekduia sp.]|nr:hypothetical protein [Baekduia sp.]